MEDCHIIKFNKLMSYKKDIHPSDICFFPEDEEGFIEQSTFQQLQDYLAMHWKTFSISKNSEKKK